MLSSRPSFFSFFHLVDSTSTGSSHTDGAPYAISFTAELQHYMQDDSSIYRTRLGKDCKRWTLAKHVLRAFVALEPATVARRGIPRYLVIKMQLECFLTRHSTHSQRVRAPRRSSSRNYAGECKSKSSSPPSSASSQKGENAKDRKPQSSNRK